MIKSFFADITCGENCWTAENDICRCSCGGKNHGIRLRGATAERTAKIQGYRYRLIGVGSMKEMCDLGIEKLLNLKKDDPDFEKNFWMDGEIKKPKSWMLEREMSYPGAIFRLMRPTNNQIKWKEFDPFRNQLATDRKFYPGLLWERIDEA